jgi:hypothetical protein
VKYLLIVLSVVLTAAGLTRPEFAGRAAQLLIACTTIAVVATVARRRWDDVAEGSARPFVPPEPVVTSGVETPDVTELVRAIESSDGKIPSLVTRHLAEACRGRLGDRHRLHLHSEADRAAIEALVSSTMWTLLGADADDTIDVPIRALPQLLDEVESL